MAIGLGLVQPVLDVIAREVGCRVDCYLVWVEAGPSVQIDVHDADWQDKLPARKVFNAIGAEVQALTDLRLMKMVGCANEGGILTVRLSADQGGFAMGMGWR